MMKVLQRSKASETIRSLSHLDKADYEEMFVAKATDAKRWSAEQWARAAIEGAPGMRVSAPRLWRVIGLRMGPRSPKHINGWRIDAREDDWIRLEAASAYATIHVIVRVEPDEVQEAMFIRYDRAIGALIWAVVGPFHRRAMPAILRHAVKTL